MFIKITRQTFLSGVVANVGDVFEVDPETAKQTVAHNKAEIIDAPDQPVAEPPKPKVKKVEANKPSKEDAAK